MLYITFTSLFSEKKAIYNPDHNVIFVTSRGSGIRGVKLTADVRVFS